MKNKKIVVIMTDTQRPDMLGCYGNPDLKTPNIDRLASEGMRFNKAYTCQPVCGPARSALFTGTYPHSNGSWGNSMALGDNVKTIGQRLSDNGFKTAYIGKWHLDGGDYFGNGICLNGWDEKYWYDMRRFLEEMTDDERLKSRKPITMEQEEVKEENTYGHKCSDKAIDFLETHAQEDFLLVVSYDEPHHPFHCPKPYSHMYEDYCFPKCENVWDRLENKPEHHKVWAGDKVNEDKDAIKIKNKYLFGCNSYVDYEIGRVLDKIDQIAPDALIIYTSDHGDMLESHSIHNKGPAMYDEITRIPFLAKCKGQIEASQVCNLPVSHINVVPTILDVCGLNVPQNIEGKSIAPTLENPNITVNDHIFMEFGRFEIDHDGFGGFQPIRSVFDGRYKLTVNLLSSDELYDMEKDPFEMHNLIETDEFIQIRNKLHDKLLDWMDETRDPFRGYYWECRPWRNDACTPTWAYRGYTRQRENDDYEPRQLDYSTGLEMEHATRKK